MSTKSRMQITPRDPAIIGLLLLAACSDDVTRSVSSSPVPAPPIVVNVNDAVGAVVGKTISYDASKGGVAFASTGAGTLQYQVTFENAANGLTAVGAVVTGRPFAPGVTWATIVATDSLKRSASDRFAIVAFDSVLAIPTLPATPFLYTDAANPLPAHFRATINGTSVVATDNTPVDNPITDAGASLGRVLFYDMRLSANDQLSCAGCHSQFLAFGDTPALSVGFAGGLTGRHTPALTNARFYQRGRFFWDERAATLEAQVMGPIQSPVEMGMTIENLVAKVRTTSYYPPLFQAAFGSATITDAGIARALAQYVRSLVSTNAKYDRALAGTATLTAQEQQGEALFRSSGCASCHITVSQVSDSVHNIGLDALDTDIGAGNGAFKAPSLRNVAVRAPYMHDGRFNTLEELCCFSTQASSPTRTSTCASETRMALRDGSA